MSNSKFATVVAQGVTAVCECVLSPEELLSADFHPALNAAALAHLPIVIVIENRGFAGKVPLPMAFANPCLVDLAPAYRLRGMRIKGETQYRDTIAYAKQQCMAGHGPFIIERLYGERENDE